MQSNRKVYIVIIIILVIFFLVLFYLFGINNLKKEAAKTTLIVGNSSIWTYSNKHWQNITSNKDITSLSWQKYKVFIDNKKLGTYYLWYSDKWYLFDMHKKSINYTGNLLAISSNFSLKELDYDTTTITDFTYVNQLLSSNNIDLTTANFTTKTVSKIDVDNDGVAEDFYVVSNVFPIGYSNTTNFSFVFMVKDNTVYLLYNSVNTDKGLNDCKPYLNGALDIDNDDTYEIIVSCGKYSKETPIDMLYKYQDKAFKILISNQ